MFLIERLATSKGGTRDERMADDMQRIWAPWRKGYVAGPKKTECVFCLALAEESDLTLYQNNLCVVVMNRYPYTNGHLLIAPRRHEGALENLSGEEMACLMETVSASIGVLKRVMKPHGFNVGLNLGDVAGAGIEDHLHMHIVPRWQGDANFMSVLGDVRVISEDLDSTLSRLKPHFDTLVAHKE